MPLWATIIFTFVSILYLKLFYRIKFDRKEIKKQKRGCILLYTHYSNKDHYVIKAATGYRRVTYVLASSFFLNKVLKVVMHLARAISKDQFKPDISAIRNMREALKENQIIAIAPAGQTTIDGNTPYISKTVIKFIRMCKADVMVLQTHGVYLTFPKWRSSKRKCSMNTTFIPLIKAEEIDNLTDDEIYDRVLKNMSVSEYGEQEVRQRPIRGKTLIAGFENTLIKCPKCGALHSFELDKKVIRCNKCGLDIGMDKYGFLVSSDPDFKFHSIPEIYHYQREELGKMYLNGETFTTHCKVLSNLRNKELFEELGDGLVTLNKEEFSFKGTINNEEFERHYHIDTIPQLPFDPGKRFEIPNEECIFRLYPDKPKEVMDYVLIVDYLNYEREGGYESNS